MCGDKKGTIVHVLANIVVFFIRDSVKFLDVSVLTVGIFIHSS